MRRLALLPFIPSLDGPCRPATIVWRIVSIIVATIQRQSAWAWPHVGVERCEIMEPCGAHLNSTAAIIRKIFVSGIVATIFRGRPDSIFRVFAFLVRSQFLSCDLATQTPATFRGAGYETLADANAFYAAIAETAPTRLLGINFCGITSQNNQATKALTDKIARAGHGAII